MLKCLLKHNWDVVKRAGNYEYRQCTRCGKRKIKVIDGLEQPFGGIPQIGWLSGEEELRPGRFQRR